MRSIKITLKVVCMCARSVATNSSLAGPNTSIPHPGQLSLKLFTRIASPSKRRGGGPSRFVVESVEMDWAMNLLMTDLGMVSRAFEYSAARCVSSPKKRTDSKASWMRGR